MENLTKLTEILEYRLDRAKYYDEYFRSKAQTVEFLHDLVQDLKDIEYEYNSLDLDMLENRVRDLESELEEANEALAAVERFET